MVMQNRVVLLSLFAILIGIVHGQGQCLSPTLTACTNAFATFIGYDATPANQLWDNYTNLYNFLQNKISNVPGDASDWAKMCNGFEQLYGCVNGQPCFTVSAFFARGKDPLNTFSFVGLLQQYKFMCGAGFYTALHENLQCIQRVIKNFNTTLTGCVNTYQINVQHDPNQGCKYSQDLMNCYMMPFNVSQCRREEAADRWWACETQRQFAMPQFPNCGLTCDLQFPGGPPPPSTVQFMAEHYKFSEGKHWFKLPDVFVEKSNGQWQLTEGRWISEVENN